MRLQVHRTLLALPLIAAPSACTVAQDESPDVAPAQERATAEVDDPMASFARLVGGEWHITSTSGQTPFHAWHWGPGKLSMRRMAFGMADGSDAANPWAGEVLYWHPGLRQVRMLTTHEDIPGVGRGVGEGTIRFDGETSNAVFDLDQPRGPRKLATRQVFDGPDTYRETLLEDTGAGFRPLAEWDFVRSEERARPPSTVGERASVELPERWKAFEELVGGTWEAGGDAASGSAFRIRSTFEWVPNVEVVLARVRARNGEGETAREVEAFVYRDVRTEAIRCLALSSRGGVYEGQVTVVEGGALEFELKGYEGDRVVPQVARFELEKGGKLRTRVWSVEGGARTLALDVEHEKLEPKQD